VGLLWIAQCLRKRYLFRLIADGMRFAL